MEQTWVLFPHILESIAQWLHMWLQFHIDVNIHGDTYFLDHINSGEFDIWYGEPRYVSLYMIHGGVLFSSLYFQ